MQPGWSGWFKTVAVTAMATSLAWIGAAAWWGQKHEPRAVTSLRTAARPSTSQGTLPPDRPASGPPGSSMIVPVEGVAPDQLEDNFTQAREAGRPHDAIDIMAPQGTLVVAAATGTVEKLFVSKAGGNTVYVRSPDGTRIYYYAHLDSYAPDLREGARIAQGERIGRVGYTGNAKPDAPHLHFAVMATSPERKWYEAATALNPYPLLTQPRD